MALTVTLVEDKDTKGTKRFAEVLEDELDTAKVGTLYVPKPTLKDLGWEPGSELKLTLSA